MGHWSRALRTVLLPNKPACRLGTFCSHSATSRQTAASTRTFRSLHPKSWTSSSEARSKRSTFATAWSIAPLSSWMLGSRRYTSFEKNVGWDAPIETSLDPLSTDLGYLASEAFLSKACALEVLQLWRLHHWMRMMSSWRSTTRGSQTARSSL